MRYLLLMITLVFWGCDEDEKDIFFTGEVRVQFENDTVLLPLQSSDTLTTFEFKLTSLFTHSGYNEQGSLINSQFIYQRECDEDCYLDMIDPAQTNETINSSLIPIEIREDSSGEAIYTFSYIGFGFECGQGIYNVKWGTENVPVREAKNEDCGLNSQEIVPAMELREGQTISVTLEYNLEDSIVPDDDDVGGVEEYGQKRMDCQQNPTVESPSEGDAICLKFPKLDATATVE